MRTALLKLSSALFVIVFAVAACTKIDETDLGLGLIPTVDNIHTFDTTLDVITTTYDLPDSTRLSSAENHFFGAITGDPVFGNVEARAYFELRPGTLVSNDSTPFYDTIVGFDSAVFTVGINSYYGDTNVAQMVQVEELDAPGLPASALSDTLYHYDSAFLIRDPRPVKSTFLASPKMVTPRNLKDTMIILYNNDTVKVANCIRFKLDNTFASKLFTADKSNYRSDAAFENLIRGFALSVNTAMGGKGLFSIDLNSANTAVEFYYRIRRNNILDTITTAYTFSNFCGHAVYYNWNKSGSTYGNYTPTADPRGDSLVYIKSVPGTFTVVKIPGIENLSNRVVNRAELIVNQIGGTPIFNPQINSPYLLQLEAIDTLALNKFLFIPHDFGLDISGQPNFFYFGGYRPSYPAYYDNLGQKIYKYTFNITGYMQGIITRDERNYDLRLFAPYAVLGIAYNPLGAERVVLGGGTHSTARMKVRMIYSKL